MAADFFETAYETYWEIVDSHAIPLPVALLPYGYGQSSNDPIYSEMEAEFTRTLLNSFNQFIVGIHRLLVWEKVIAAYTEHQALDLHMEFTQHSLYYMLHQPYEFSARIVHAATELCYTKGLSSGVLSKTDIPDKWITFESFKKVAMYWTAGNPLAKAIKKINGKGFRAGTQDYRNRAQHGIPPGLDFGMTNVITRTFLPTGIVAYDFGNAPPLRTADLLPLLVKESEYMAAALKAYRSLVDEQADYAGYSPHPKP